MPTIVFFLARMGVVTAGFLIKHFKYAILIIFILGAVLSPGTDVVSQLMMAGPMTILYVFSIGIAWVFAKKRTTT
jgi:sec-independent protein translocase protein TatC